MLQRGLALSTPQPLSPKPLKAQWSWPSRQSRHSSVHSRRPSSCLNSGLLAALLARLVVSLPFLFLHAREKIYCQDAVIVIHFGRHNVFPVRGRYIHRISIVGSVACSLCVPGPRLHSWAHARLSHPASSPQKQLRLRLADRKTRLSTRLSRRKNSDRGTLPSHATLSGLKVLQPRPCAA